MDQYGSLNHTKRERKYHIVFIPKCRRKAIDGALRQDLGPVLRTLAERKESRIEEGYLIPDHVHMLLSVPPKYAVSQVVGASRRRARSTWRARTWSESVTS